MQNFIKLSAAVHELSCPQRKKTVENNAVVVTTDSNKFRLQVFGGLVGQLVRY